MNYPDKELKEFFEKEAGCTPEEAQQTVDIIAQIRDGGPKAIDKLVVEGKLVEVIDLEGELKDVTRGIAGPT